MIDRLVHHAEDVALKGDSYRPQKTATSAAPTSRNHRRITTNRPVPGVRSDAVRVSFQVPLTQGRFGQRVGATSA